MGGQRGYLKDNFLSYAEDPGAYQRADVAQQKTNLPDEGQLRKRSGSQFKFTCPKARASPSLPSDKHWHEVCYVFWFF